MKLKYLFNKTALSLVVIFGSLFAASTAYAVTAIPACSNGTLSNTSVCQDVSKGHSSSKDPVINIIKAALVFISYVAGVAAVILIIISGIRFITAGGNPDKVSQARSTLTYALIGIFIVLVGQGIVAFVLDKVS
jgi:hypothetical protein